MSSPNNSDTSSCSTTSTMSTSTSATSTNTSTYPDYTRLEHHLTSLLNLARDVLNPEGFLHRWLISGLLAADKLARIQDALNRYFSKTRISHEGDCKVVDEEDCKIVQYHVLAMQTLMRMIESALGLSNSGCKGEGRRGGKVVWPEVGREEKEEGEEMQRRVYEDVEELVFRCVESSD